jgi:hypothetical protein
MHILTIQTKFTFGDRVHYDSRIQQCSGTGIVYAITVDSERLVDYMIKIDEGGCSNLQPGIQEEELTLLESNPEPAP